MIINIILGFIFLGGFITLIGQIKRKIPELVAVPDTVIAERLQHNSTKAYLFIVHLFQFRFFYREGHYQARLWRGLVKLLYKIHILVMKFDNFLLMLMKRAKPTIGEDSNNTNGEYWKQLYRQPVADPPVSAEKSSPHTTDLTSLPYVASSVKSSEASPAGGGASPVKSAKPAKSYPLDSEVSDPVTSPGERVRVRRRSVAGGTRTKK